MAIGKLNKSFKKVPDSNSNQPLAITNLAFAHEFSSAGDNVIDFGSLVLPSEWTLSGRSNPTPSEILGANLRFFKNQIIVSSSSKGLIQPSQYTVTSSNIVFNTFVSEAGESFEVQVLGATSLGNQLVDSRTLKVEGSLAASTVDFNIGMAVKIFPEQILVFIDGNVKKRNQDNSSALTSTGDYYMVDASNTGSSSVVRFNVTSASPRNVVVVSVGGFAERPTISIMQEVEKLSGQIDAMVPYLAIEAGVPESTFQSAPTSPDLLQFGQDLALVKAQIISVGKLGDFVYSPALSLAQFQAQRDTTWVSVNGAMITGSNLHTLSGYDQLPVMSGWFAKINN